MKIFFRILSIIIEIVIALAIFIVIIQKTPLFDRAIPGREDNEITTGTTNPSEEKIIINNNTTQQTWGNSYTGTKTTTLSTTRYTREIIDQPVRLGRSCVAPNWQIISDKQSIIAYNSPIANSKNECLSEIRICQNGKLAGSFSYQTCDYMIDGRITRTVWGKIVTIDSNKGASDREQTFIDLSDYLAEKKRKEEYIQPSQEPDQTPLTIAQIRAQTMNNSDIIQPARDLTDTLDQTSFRDSDDTTKHQTCLTPLLTSIHNVEFVYAYDNASNSNSTDCNVQKRSCINGKLSGSYQHKSCTINTNSTNNSLIHITSLPSTIFQGMPLVSLPYVRPISESVYDTFRLNYNNSQSSSNWWQNYIEFADCTTPRWTSIKHHKRVIAYRLPTETANSLCNPEPRVCRDGILWWTYTYPSCSVAPAIAHEPSWLQKTAKKIGNWWRGL